MTRYSCYVHVVYTTHCSTSTLGQLAHMCDKCNVPMQCKLQMYACTMNTRIAIHTCIFGVVISQVVEINQQQQQQQFICSLIIA